jgi:PAP_fibrillin
MTRFSRLALLLLWSQAQLVRLVASFGIQNKPSPRICSHQSSPFVPNAVSDAIVDGVDDNEATENNRLRDNLKRQILQLGASYDRGFGASPRVRTKMEGVLNNLESLNPQVNAARFIDGPETTTLMGQNNLNSQVSPLKGNWRMIWTTASDVLLLGANPFVSVGAIYQFIDPPIVTNVIDFFPRLQNLFPPSLSVPNSLARAKVTTRASSRRNQPDRVGLNFERVELSGQEFLGQDVSNRLSPLGVDLPRLELPEDVGFFDVTYLDDELLVIRQNAPGGCFVLVQVDGADTVP